MNFKRASIHILFTGIISFCLVGFIHGPEQKALEQIKANYNTNIQRFIEYINSFQDKLREAKEIPNEAIQKQYFLKLREHYKTIEPLLCHVIHGAEKDLNGPNVPHLIHDVAIAETESPRGLQVLEAQLFDEKSSNETIIESLQLLKNRAVRIQKLFRATYFTDRQVFEAARFELIRVATLGISGFDSPILHNSIPEAITAMNSMEEMLRIYIINIDEPLLAKRLNQLFSNAKSYAEGHLDFKKFDRLYFIKTYLDPLYAAIYDLHIQTGIETIDQVSSTTQRVNYHAKSMFQTDFLNPYGFSKFQYEVHQPKMEALGKLLFYDPILSGNNKRACASCHQPQQAFTDGVAKSIAIDQKGTVNRNSPTLLNCSYQNEFFWDKRAPNLNNQIEHVTNSHLEFNTNFDDIVKRLRKSNAYVMLFQEAFESKEGKRAIGTTTVKEALSQYIKSLNALNSRFDQYMRGEGDELTEVEKKGFNLFMGKAQCGTCHFLPTFYGTIPPYFNDNDAEVLSVPQEAKSKKVDIDLGMAHSFDFEYLKGAFKTSTVRNIELTAPYMHNGCFTTLEEVVEFYNKGGGLGQHYGYEHQTLPSDKLKLSGKERKSLIAFMKALTDRGNFLAPTSLPEIDDKELNQRTIGGEY